MNEKVLIAGFGGQGIMLLGKVLAYSAVKEKKFSTWLPSYGAEMRGGTAHCWVRISDKKIPSPVFAKPGVFFIFNQPSWDKFSSKIDSSSFVILNSSLVNTKTERKNIKKIALNEVALDLGSLKIINIIALGAFLKYKKIIRPKTVEKVLKEFFDKKEIQDINLKGFRWGLSNG